MKRRKFMKLSAMSLPVLVGLPRVEAGILNKNINWDRTLVLVELKGGNDGLNTIIPYSDGTYYEKRGNLAIPADTVIPLSQELGLHPALESLKPVWDEQNLAVILGLGYPEPNRSHFRSIDIWDSASDSNQYLSDGWISQMFEASAPPDTHLADGLVIGGGDMGPLEGPAMRNISLDTPEGFIEGAQDVSSLPEDSGLEVLNHLIHVQNTVFDSVGKLESAMGNGIVLETSFPNTALGQNLFQAASILANGVQVPVIKVSHGSFDTHNQQAGTHSNLLSQLSEALSAFKSALIEMDLWNQVTVMTYSEFGRRVEVNASNGTDHGTAAPHFLMGGMVKGGFYGEQPSLTDLDNGDLKFTTDFRSVYSSLATSWWGMEHPFERKYPVLPFISP